MCFSEEIAGHVRSPYFKHCVIDDFTRYRWVKTLKDKKAKIVLNVFFFGNSKSKRKPNKL